MDGPPQRVGISYDRSTRHEVFSRNEHDFGRTNAATRIPRTNGKLNSENGKDSTAEGSKDDNTLEANEILLQLNEDPCCNGSSEAGESFSGDGTTRTNPPRPRLEESDAKRQIELIFRTPACWRSETDQTHLLYLLQRFPALAAHNFDWDYNLFWQHGSEWSTPLCFLLASGANLETIEAVYTLNPEAIWKPQGVHRDLPLHFACRFGVAEDVLVFLIQKFPHAVVVSNASGMLPIHCALGKKDVFPYGTFSHATLETIKIMADLFPQSLVKEEQESHRTPLQIAFAHAYSFEVIDYILSKLPPKMESFGLKAGCYHNKRFSVCMGRSESVLVSKLLPRLQRFHCEPSEWRIEGLVHLLGFLQQNSSLVHCQLTNLSSSLLLEDAVVNAFSGLLRCNNTLESLSLSLLSGGESSDTTSFFQCLDQSLQTNTRLQSLALANFSLTCKGLHNFLASSCSPRSVTLSNTTLLPSTEDDTNWTHPVRSNTLQNLVLSACNFAQSTEDVSDTSFLTFLHGTAALPRLREMTVGMRQERALDITEPLVHLLKSRSLQSLRIRGLSAHIRPVCKSLQSSLALRRLDFPSLMEARENRGLLSDTLENHNAKIQFVQMPPTRDKKIWDENEARKILYLTRLNHFGRGQLRESNTAKSSVVNLLEKMASQTRDFQPEEVLSIYFGLLRESPSLWCNTTHHEDKEDSVGRRRKRQRLL